MMGSRVIQTTKEYITAWKNPTSAPGVLNWTNESNVFASDDAYAVSDNEPDAAQLKVQGFDFSEVIGQVVGIEVQYERKETSTDTPTVGLQLLNSSGLGIGETKTDSSVPASDAYAAFGGASDLWGTSGVFTPAVVQSASFGVAITKNSTTGNSSLSIDHVQIRISYRR